MKDKDQQKYYKHIAFQKISSNYVIDQKTINQLATSTIIPYVSTKFKLRKQVNYQTQIRVSTFFPVLIIFNRIKTIITKKYTKHFFKLLKIISFIKKIQYMIKTKKQKHQIEAYRAILTRSSKIYIKKGIQIIQTLFVKKALINKVTGLKNIQFMNRFIIQPFDKKTKSRSQIIVTQTIKIQRKQINLISPRIPKPFELEELYENIQYENKFWLTQKFTNF